MASKFSLVSCTTILLLLVLGCNTKRTSVKDFTPEPYTRAVTYIDLLSAQWGATNIAAALGVPGYAKYETPYNVINLAFVVAYGSADAAAIWMNPRGYMNSDDTTFGKTNDEIQKSWKKLYNDNGIKIVLSAFGATWLPTAENAQITCDRLAELVIQNNLDGIDLDYEDNDAMNHGKAEEWLIKCTQTIRQKLPKGQYLLTHAPQAPYFIGKRVYPNGGYVTINEEVGSLIDWYNVQFYNQGDTRYDTYQSLFIDEEFGPWNHTAVLEINKNGVPLDKIVVGKPVTRQDATNTGYVPENDLYEWGLQAEYQIGWHGGWMDWQYLSDIKSKEGEFMATVVGEYAPLSVEHEETDAAEE